MSKVYGCFFTIIFIIIIIIAAAPSVLKTEN